MFESLTLKNFQVHRKLAIEFDRRITTIVGESDAGKSAIVRALRWVCLNQTSGGFRRHGSDNTSVEIKLGNRTVRRTRKKSGNHYHFDRNRFDAVRSDVPEQIKHALNVQGINFQSQFDSPFWFNDTAGQVSRSLNAIVDLSIIDKTMANISTQLRKAQASYEVTEQRLKAAKEEVESLSWAEECDEELKEVESLEKGLIEVRQKAENLGALVRQVQSLEDGLENTKDNVLIGHKAVRLGQAWRAKVAQAKDLRDLVQELTTIEQLSKLTVPSPDHLGTVISDRTELASIVTQIQSKEKDQCQVQERLEPLLRMLRTSITKRCPLCGSRTIRSQL